MNVKEMSLPIPKNGKPITNEEWLRSCNTEQLAEEIYEYAMTPHWQISKEVILEWLKQPHTPFS